MAYPPEHLAGTHAVATQPRDKAGRYVSPEDRQGESMKREKKALGASDVQAPFRPAPIKPRIRPRGETPETLSKGLY